MFNTHIGRVAVLSWAAYTVAACATMAVIASTWDYNRDIARLEETVASLRQRILAATEARGKTYVRDLATTVMSAHDKDAEPLTTTLLLAKNSEFGTLTTRPFTLSSLCVKYRPDGTDFVIVSLPSEKRTLCDHTPGPANFASYHLQNNILALAHEDSRSIRHYTAQKMNGDELVWLMAIAPTPDDVLVVDSTDDRNSSYPYLPAWGHSATVLLSLAVAAFVARSSRRLAQAGNSLASIAELLLKIKKDLHDARISLGSISWDGLHDLDGPSVRRLADKTATVSRVWDQLACPIADVNAHLSAANWLRKKVLAWDGVAEVTELAKTAKRIAAEEGTATETPIVVEVEDEIAQQISEYDAVTILRNLIGNAIKHGEPPVAVTVRRIVSGPDQKGQSAEIVVVNDGQPYDKHNANGDGHGLKIVEGLAKKYGGDFRIERGRNGRGAVARLTLDI
ncbi:MAG: hypothetical protein OXF11_21485 [Deltaproteobacteria bacterium]|nr:hypothetical protein [Deltaproteobacteria bacterium]